MSKKKDGAQPDPKGPAIRRIRKELGISEVEFGRRLGEVLGKDRPITQQYISRLELGHETLHPGRVTPVAKALGVSIQRIYAESRKKLPAQPKSCTTENDPS